MQNSAFWLGAGLAVAGVLIFVWKKETAAENGIEFLGMRFKLSHPTLVIVVLGIVLIVKYPYVPDRDVQTAEPEKGDTPASTPGAPHVDTAGSKDAAEQDGPGGSGGTSNGGAPGNTDLNAIADPAPRETDTAPAPAPAPKPPSRKPKVMTTPSPTWVYLGTAKDGALPSNTFNITQFPITGQDIEAIVPVNTRVTAPYTPDDTNWYFGKIVGYLSVGQHVSVRRLATVKMSESDPEYIWAEVDVSPAPAR